MPKKKMKTNQDGGSVTAKDPGAAAKELEKNQKGAAKMGYDQKFGAARMSPSKMGDAKAGELMQGAAKYYDGAGQYMNGAPKYEGAAKHHGPMKEHGPMKGHEGPMDMHEGPMDMHKGPMKEHGPMDAGHGEDPGHTHSDTASAIKGEGVNIVAKRKSPVDDQELLKQEQQQYDANTQNVVRSLAQQDSLNLANKGEKFRAELLYGKNYDYTKKLPGSFPSEGRVTQYTAGQRRKKYASLKRKALEIQGPRPTQANRDYIDYK